MLLKYIILFLLIGINISHAQMPNLKNNSAGVSTNTSFAQDKVEEKIDDEEMFDEGKIYLGYGDYQKKQTMGGQDICYISIKLKNGTIYPLEMLRMKFTWPLWNKTLTFTGFVQDEKNQVTYRIAGPPCRRLEEKPKIAVNNCVLADKSLNDCGKMIKLTPFFEF